MIQSEHQRLLDLDLRHVWHPFTQMQVWPDDQPLVIVAGEGNYLIDARGSRYLDGVSSLWVNIHGHRKAEIDEALIAQLRQVAHTTLLGLASAPSIELAARLVKLAPPGLNRVFYSDSGSTAVEVAIKMAFQYWRQKGRPEKRVFVALKEAYHGDTVGAVSAGGIDLFHEIFQELLFPVTRIPTPYRYRWPGPGDCATACLDAAEALFEQRGKELAALIIEPLVQGAAGMITQPVGFLRELAALCRRHDVLLICDEVATGFGRTGTMFAVEQERVAPDLLLAAGSHARHRPRLRRISRSSPGQANLLSWPQLHRKSVGLRGGAGESRPFRVGEHLGTDQAGDRDTRGEARVDWGVGTRRGSASAGNDDRH